MKYTCRICGEPKERDEFYHGLSKARAKPRFIRCTECKSCTNELSKRYKHTHPEVLILTYCRQRDKKRGLVCDLTKEIVKDLISKPCAYCGVAGDKMTLDRIDNHGGYTVDNVNQACLLCNTIKRDLPYPAWLLLVPGMREARTRGLLDAWMSEQSDRRGNKFI